MDLTHNGEDEKADRVPERFRGITFHAVVAGLCVFIPLPFVDEWAIGRSRRSMVGRLLPASTSWDKAQLNLLANGRSDWRRGCLRLPWVVIRKLIFWPIKRLIRKLLIVFAIKDAVTEMSRTFQIGYLVDVSVGEADGLPPPESGPEFPQTWQVRRAIEASLAEVDARPVRRLLRQLLSHSGALLRGAGRSVRIMVRRDRKPALDPAAAPSGAFSEIWNEVTQLLWHEEAFLTEMARVFRHHLKNPPVDP